MPVAIWKRQGFNSVAEFESSLKQMYWDRKLSQRQIASELECDTTVIENWFKRLQINTRNQKDAIRNAKTRHVQIKEIEQEVFNGLMLSDLHIEHGAFQSRASFGVKHLEFAQSIIDHTTSFEWRNISYNKISCGWHAKTVFSLELEEQKQRWYTDNIKIVPEDIDLSPGTMLWWYLGDGYLTKYGAQLCTDSFSKEENLFLVDLINKKQIPCHLTPGNRIRIEGNGGMKKLLSFIGRSPVVCYQYKWGEYC